MSGDEVIEFHNELKAQQVDVLVQNIAHQLKDVSGEDLNWLLLISVSNANLFDTV